ncbi:hypothetical protein VT84_23495 [Gemmata sp. SH-PL17]|nr:hypothetical protein VT84_23495 [Gemmata sp. SH-PL17]
MPQVVNAYQVLHLKHLKAVSHSRQVRHLPHLGQMSHLKPSR